ncbi:hypothetical protein LCGC14_1867850 [marine sediment metagenome]|uniref:HNH nuclease domain-containing protein n=1 Tax=marine sediment metagenome TaxID=412755 RepID=A0A0F9G5S0_9ZZZZ
MKWFRFYYEVAEDPKVQTLPTRLFKLWINVLCLAAKNKGVVPPVPQIAYALRMGRARVDLDMDALRRAGLFDSTPVGLIPHNWNGRQFTSDTSDQRVERYRGRVKAAGRKVGGYLKHSKSVMERDGHHCVYCGNSTRLCIDHAVPVQLGGDDSPDNLMTACKQCNSGKAGRTPEQAGYSFHNKKSEIVYQRYVSRLPAFAFHGDSDDPVTPPETEEQRTDSETESGM